ncbi:MAG: N-acyl-D-glutamate deacylase [Gammaproteobacteria bacterium]|nr:N-acyl-D-glutamate deacylase [Gammaproteobacteria bacterium]
MWDTLIRNATVIDGTGEKPVVEDVALLNGQVAARGARLQGQADHEIDAAGLWLMPGLLDIHTHFDLEVELAPGLPEAVRHGTTTVVVSNCSLGLAYGAQRRDGADPIVDCFARVENIPKDVLRQVADRATWTTSAQYLEHLRQLPLGINIVPMIPHSMLRIEAMGFEASISRNPTPAELDTMANLLETGLQEGYAGFSTDALPFHYLANDPNRRARIPAQHGSYREIKHLTGLCRRYERVWQATPAKDSPLLVLRNFLLSSGRLYGKPLKITAVAALDLVANRGLLKLALTMTRLLNSRLVDGRFALQALAARFKVWGEGPVTPIFEEIPELRLLNEPDLEDRDSRLQVLKNPDFVHRFKRMWYRGKRGFGIARLKRWFVREDFAFPRRLSDMVIDRCPVLAWSGMDLQQVFARVRSVQKGTCSASTPEEATACNAMPAGLNCEAQFLIELLKQFDTDLYWYSVFANKDEARRLQLLLHPEILPGFNDSGAHLTNMAFYDANLRGLQSAAKRGLETVAYLVRRLTRDPADFFNIDAGRISIGSRADITLIDPDALAGYDSEAHIDSRYREEFGHHQLVNRSDGVVPYVFVAGHLAWHCDGFTPEYGKHPWGSALTAQH